MAFAEVECASRDAPNALQTNIVVMLDVTLHKTPCIFQRQRCSRPDALAFERFVPPFDFPFD